MTAIKKNVTRVALIMLTAILVFSIGTVTVYAGAGAGKDGAVERPTELPTTPIPTEPAETPPPVETAPPVETPPPAETVPPVETPPPTETATPPAETAPPTPMPPPEPPAQEPDEAVVPIEPTEAVIPVEATDLRVNPQTGDDFSRVGLYLSAIGLLIMSVAAFYIRKRMAIAKQKK